MFDILIAITGVMAFIGLVCIFTVRGHAKPPINSDAESIVYDEETVDVPILIAVQAQSDLDVVESIIDEVNKNLIGSNKSKPEIKYRVINETHIEFIVLLRALSSTNIFILRQEFLRLVKHKFDVTEIKLLFPTNTELYQINRTTTGGINNALTKYN